MSQTQQQASTEHPERRGRQERQVPRHAPGSANGSDEGSQAQAAKKRSPKRIAKTSFEGSTVTITFVGHEEPLRFDLSDLPDSMRLEMLKRGVADTLRSAYTNADDPHAAAHETAQKLRAGEWKPGRESAQREYEPIIEALAQHLGEQGRIPNDATADPQRWVVEHYIPLYARKQGHVMTNGRVMAERSKRELERHPALAPIVARLLEQRAGAETSPAPDLDV